MKKVTATSANAIKRYRTMCGYTQQALADTVGMHIRQIQKLESGEIDPANLTLKNGIALATALGIDPNDLLR